MWFVFGMSILFNLASLLTASYAVYYVAEWLTKAIWASFAVSAICLLALEYIKRKSSGEFWQVYYWKDKLAYGWIFIAALCLALSIAASFYGTKKGTDNLAPPPTLVDAKEEQEKIQEQIDYLKSENERLSKPDPHQGVPLLPAQRQMKTNGQVLAGLFERQNELTEMLRGKNEILTEEYSEEVDNTGWILAGVSIFFEILFELCIWFIWYYYYRSYIEDKQVNPHLYRSGVYATANGNLVSSPTPVNPVKKNIGTGPEPTFQTRKTNEAKQFVGSENNRLSVAIDYTKTIKDMRNWYRQATTAAQPETREKAHDQYNIRRNLLEKNGYIIEEISDTSLQVTPPETVAN